MLENRMENVSEMLLDNQKRRREAVEEYKEFLDKMVEGKQKGIRYRKWLRGALLYGSEKQFKTECDEYDFIGKFGRGLFNEERIRKTFNKNDQNIIVELAKKYGAFDY